MRDFIRFYLGPRFRRAGIACEIWAGTIERPDYDAWAHTILRDPRTWSFVSGVGYQWAGKGAVQRAICVRRRQTPPPVCLMKHLPLSL